MKHSGSGQYTEAAQKVFADASFSMKIKKDQQALIFKNGKGCYVKDENNNRYLDFYAGNGSLLHGHAHPYLTKAMRKQCKKSFLSAFTNKKEIELGNRLLKKIKGIEKIQFLSSYADAIATSIRLARDFTHKKKIIIFEESFHGHYDACMATVSEEALTFSDAQTQTLSRGVLPESVAHTLVLSLNDSEQLRKTFAVYGQEIAAVLLQPLVLSCGLLHLQDDFFVQVVQECEKHKAVLIRDEYLTSFRLSFEQNEFSFSEKKDLVIMGHCLNMGLPFAMLAGKEKIMSLLSSKDSQKELLYDNSYGNQWQAALASAQLDLLQETSYYQRMQKLGEHLQKKFAEFIKPQNDKFFSIDLLCQGSIFWFFFRLGTPKVNREEPRFLQKKDIWPQSENIYHYIFQELLKCGILLAPSFTMPLYLNDAMSEEEIDFFIQELAKVLKKMPQPEELLWQA